MRLSIEKTDGEGGGRGGGGEGRGGEGWGAGDDRTIIFFAQ
jgi:hypothetical protein